jgi:tetrahydromethanopterin S-methyltransferase subunit F
MEAATVRRAPAVRAPAPKAPARQAPARRREPARRPGGQLIPIAAGAATAVRQLPDSGLMVRMTRGRAWIGVLGVLLAGIVAINVITLSLSAAAGHIDRNIGALEDESSLLRTRDARLYGSARVRHEAAALGLAAASSDQIAYLRASKQDAAIAAQRLAAAASGY